MDFKIRPKLMKDVKQYCKINDIDDVNDFLNRCIVQGFNIMKYGVSPIDNIERESNGIKGIEDNKKESIRSKVDNSKKNITEQVVNEKIDIDNKEDEKKIKSETRKIRIIKKQ